MLFPFSCFSLLAHHDDVISLPVAPKNATMHWTKHKASDHFSIKAGTLVGCGATDRDAGLGVVHLKTGERFALVSGAHDHHQLSNFPSARLVHDFAIVIIPHVSDYGKGSTVLLGGHMVAKKIKLDYCGFLHVAGKQWSKTVEGHPHLVPSSDQGWNPGALLPGYKQHSTWPESLFSVTGFAYMDKSFNSYGDYLHLLLAETIP